MEDNWNKKLKKVQKQLDDVSPSFCLAKWLQVTTNLSSGYTHSCHHPTPHKVSVPEVIQNPSAIHNSKVKKEQRKKMLEGSRPEECSYCWKVEDSTGDHFSDRIIKSSEDWATQRFNEVAKSKWDENINPSYMEVMFSHSCNFNCTYCAPHISSTIMKDVKENGDYGPGTWPLQMLKERDLLPFEGKENENPYFQAFWKWFPELSKELQHFRITGGEPLLSTSTYKTLKYLLDNPRPNLNLIINSNLNVPETLILKTLTLAKKLLSQGNIKSIELYTSLDTYGAQAEYIRHGMKYDHVLRNAKLFLNKVSDIKVTFMCTFNIFCFPSFLPFLKDISSFKEKYNTSNDYNQRVCLDVSILHHPNFLSALLAPQEFRNGFIKCVDFVKENLVSENNKWGFTDYELNKIVRLFNYLNDDNAIEELTCSEENILMFLHQHLYETLERKKLDHRVIFPEYKEFFDTIKTKADKHWDPEFMGYMEYIRARGKHAWRDKNAFVMFRDDVLNPITKSFCAAKWYNATIWLETGKTASCHHPPAHKIELPELEKDHRALHNTYKKLIQRKAMLKGQRPKECEYCWKVEDISDQHISDRVFKSIIYSKEEINKIGNSEWYDFVDLKTVELSFSRQCNFACAYCNKDFSTRWQKDLKENGVYQNLVTNGARAYNDLTEFDTYHEDSESNPYIQAFWKWWDESLKDSLKDIRLTGGEPLLSPTTWNIIEKVKTDRPDLSFSINSNLGVKDELIDKLIEASKKMNHFSIYTSCEAYGKQAEFIRDGLDYNKFIANLVKLIENANLESLNMMMTVNALAIFSITEFLNEMIKLKNKYGARFPALSLNILRYPDFLNISTLPKDICEERATALEIWLDQNKTNNKLLNHERDSIRRLIDYLQEIKRPHYKADDITNRVKDLKSFLEQYSKRREKPLEGTFPEQFLGWIRDK